MSTAPTVKELVKAVGTFAHNPSLPLPDDLVQIIDNFLYKRTDKLDESVADKVHDELLPIFKQDIAQDTARYAAFIAVLRRLQPLIGQTTTVLQWLDLLLPALANLGLDKDLATETQGFMLDILTGGDGNDTTSFTRGATTPVAEKIISLWFQEVDLLRNCSNPAQDFKEKLMRETLVLYGKKRPKEFMTVVDHFVCKRSHRAGALLLLSSFVQSQPPHLYLILQTPLFGNLLNCLQRDTSTTIMSVALTGLTMVLPHVPSSLVPYLPALFNIYARLLFWERELSVDADSEESKERRLSLNAINWEVCPFSSDVDDTNIPQLLDYFTILYGLYPINFMDYIRKPQRYLRHAEASDSDVIEVQPTEIRHASERFRQCHLLHENFYNLTIDSEKTDFGRWIKSEPAEVVADCMALRQLPDQPSEASLDIARMLESEVNDLETDERESGLLNSSFIIGPSGSEDIRHSSVSSISPSRSGSRSIQTASIRDSSSTIRSETEGDSPTLTRQLDLMNSNKAVNVPSLSLSHHESIPEKGASHSHPNLPGPSMQLSDAAANDSQRKLLRYVYLLYNDLVFERFLKQQHLTHIGELRRRHIREAASEAETQNIITANKHLKQRLEEAKKAEIQAKTEAEKSRALSKKWEADIFNKLKVLRDEQKKWNIERSSMQAELKGAKDEAEDLRKLVCEVEVRELALKQKIQSADISFGELEHLNNEVTRLTVSERAYQAQEVERQACITRAAEADGRAKAAEMKLATRESEIQHIQDLYQSQLAELNSRLQETSNTGEAHSVEASRATQDEMRKRMHELSRKNTSRPKLSRSRSRLSVDTEDDMSSNPGSPLESMTRRRQSHSGSEIFETTSYNATPPLEPLGSLLPGSAQASSLALQGDEGSSTKTDNSSTKAERQTSKGKLQ
ncbi:Hamartin protein-domain-containing protein [Xylaria bambusicola]|uniref:Hamartin protein-domain-containing protein n=1 Tax=Xylaria bambusicola TaxID=326684 RepID=UPI0020081BC1|nr:Hamartin protein-domain-containing protein [Xylaria bambusicola]KAI0508564.1 Hamartin protein-domain-containing protein [Xylaria bambusicola]